MNFGFVAGVTGLFFLFGVAFGLLAVIAASALRRDAQRARRTRARRERSDTGHSAGSDGTGSSSGWIDTMASGWEEPPELDEGGEDNATPRWPNWPSRR